MQLTTKIRMPLKQKAAFSDDGKYFSVLTSEDKLLIWETSTNVIIVDHKFDFRVYGEPASLYWIPGAKKCISPDKRKIPKVCSDCMIALGTAKGDLILYNVTTNNLFLHLVARHSDSLNDICYCCEKKFLYTCSSDKSIAAWDINSGALKSRWKADDHPTYSLCLINKDNLLSSSKAILLWNLAETVILKKFAESSPVVFKILPVNIDSSVNYFLSLALNEDKINVWSLCADTNEEPVAVFETSGVPKDLDILSYSNESKSLLVCCSTDEGYFQVFEHTLNGHSKKKSQPLKPCMMEKVTSKNERLDGSSVFAVKFTRNSCSLALGSNKSDFNFLNRVIKQELLKNEKNVICDDHRCSTSPSKKDVNGTAGNSSWNGISLPSPPLRERGLASSSYLVFSKANPKAVPHSSGNKGSKESCIEVALLHSKDPELISKTVKNLPQESLKMVLKEILLQMKHKHHPALRNWLNEVLRIHMHYISQHSSDFDELLSEFSNLFDPNIITETVKKIHSLKGLLGLFQLQDVSSNESDSDSDEEYMKL